MLLKFVAIALIGSFMLSPFVSPKPAEGGILTRVIAKAAYGTTKTAIKAYKTKKKMPIVAGYKKGANPLPQGYNASTTYKNMWNSIMSDLGLIK